MSSSESTNPKDKDGEKKKSDDQLEEITEEDDQEGSEVEHDDSAENDDEENDESSEDISEESEDETSDSDESDSRKCSPCSWWCCCFKKTKKVKGEAANLIGKCVKKTKTHKVKQCHSIIKDLDKNEDQTEDAGIKKTTRKASKSIMKDAKTIVNKIDKNEKRKHIHKIKTKDTKTYCKCCQHCITKTSNEQDNTSKKKKKKKTKPDKGSENEVKIANSVITAVTKLATYGIQEATKKD